MSENASTVTTNWASLKEAIQTNVKNMEQAAGEKIVEVGCPLTTRWHSFTRRPSKD
jgi:hypothetical protein